MAKKPPKKDPPPKRELGTELKSEIAAIALTKAAGKLGNELLKFATKDKLEQAGGRVSYVLFGVPELIESMFNLAISYALWATWMTEAGRDLLYARLVDLKEKNNLYRIQVVQQWVGNWLKAGTDAKNEDFQEIIRLTAWVISDHAKMDDRAWNNYIEIHDLKHPILPFDLETEVKRLEKKDQELDAASKRQKWIIGIMGVAVAIAFVVLAVWVTH